MESIKAMKGKKIKILSSADPGYLETLVNYLDKHFKVDHGMQESARPDFIQSVRPL